MGTSVKASEYGALRAIGFRVKVDGRTVLKDVQSLSVYPLEELLTSHALTLEREQRRRSRDPAEKSITVEIWLR